MQHEHYSNKNYRDIIGYIAKSKRKDRSLYDKAKDCLKTLNPDWGDVNLEVHILWDVRHYFIKSHKI